MYIENPQEFINKCCHVEGWNRACVFQIESSDGKTHHLITPKTRKKYTTTNKLIHTNKRAQNILNKRLNQTTTNKGIGL